jgi:nucleoside-diphosphate-sugar epimerase
MSRSDNNWPAYKIMKNILVTGANGFIGSHLVKELKKTHNVFTTEDTDITNIKLLEKYFNNIDTVIHLAAISKRGETEKNPDRTMEVNFMGTKNLLKISHKRDVKRFIFISSSAIYLNSNMYGKSKTAAERVCVDYANQVGLDTLILRPSNVYDLKQPKGVIGKFYSKAANKHPITINGDGSQKFDFIHVSDLVSLICKAIDADNKFLGKAFDVGSGKEHTVLEIAKAISNKIEFDGYKFEYKPIVLDVEKTQKEFSWTAKKNLLNLIKSHKL